MKQLSVILLSVLILHCFVLPEESRAQKAKAKPAVTKPADDAPIEIATGVPLILPQKWYNEIWAPFQTAMYTVTIRPKDGRPEFPGKFEKLEGPKDERTGSRLFVFRINHIFDTPGDYVVEKVFSGKDEMGDKIAKSNRWNVRVRHPRLAAPLPEENFYFYGENPSIPFATIDYPDAQAYAWSIYTAGARVDSGQGSTVYLSKYVNDSSNAVAGRQFEVRGYYLGRQFTYINPLNDSVRTTIWIFTVRRPTLDGIGILWSAEEKTSIDDLPKLIMDNNGVYNPRLFSFVYLGAKSGRALVVTPARISGLRVTADPPDFLAGQPTVSTKGKWADIVISPSRTFLESLNGEPALVTLTISFATQLQPERVTKKYRALVF